MKRGDVVRHLDDFDCKSLREGGRHSIYRNIHTGAHAPVSRHSEIPDRVVAQICKQLGIPRPGI